jgi:zinc D-Ala-D-Ala dipeptidase
LLKLVISAVPSASFTASESNWRAPNPRQKQLLKFAIYSILFAGACGQRVGLQPDRLVELTTVNPSFVIDARYSTPDNFVAARLYPANRLFLRQKVAAHLNDAQRSLASRGLRVKIWDAYRPLSVQRRMWKLVPDERYVADPEKGSNHNRGCAVDVTLADSQGHELPMPTAFDDFTERAHRDYNNLPQEEINNRKLLTDVMERNGFVPFATEWWHFDSSDCSVYPVLDVDPFGMPLP